MGLKAFSESLFVHWPRGVAAVHVPQLLLVLHQGDPVEVVLVHQGAANLVVGQEAVVVRLHWAVVADVARTVAVVAVVACRLLLFLLLLLLLLMLLFLLLLLPAGGRDPPILYITTPDPPP